MSRILFVAKDNGCASVTEQVAVLARNNGHHVVIAAEGLAMKRFEALDFNLREGDNFRGMVDFRTPANDEKDINFDAKAYLKKTRPDIVVMGLGSPINIQAQLAEEATRRNIPLVICEDFWAKSVSHLSHDKVKISLVLTVDDYSVSLVRQALPTVSALVAGNPGLKTVETNLAVRKQMNELREKFGMLYVFAGGGAESTTAELDLLVQCLNAMSSNWCLIPRFHPKYEKFQPAGMEKPYGELWREYLNPYRERVRFVEAPSTDPVAVEADLVLAGFSTLLSTAVWNNVPAACLKTAETMVSLKNHGSQYTEIPQVALGIVPVITEPTDLSQLPALNNEAVRKLVPYSAENAYKHIMRVL